MCPDASPQLRSEACDLAANNWVAAVAVADQIADPWYACQAYAWCGRFAPAAESVALIENAFRRACASKDAYQRLAANAWPLRALIELGLSDRAVAAFEAIADAGSDADLSSGRRAEAYFLVFEALAAGPRDLAARALDWLLVPIDPAGHWRERRAVREAMIQAATIGLIPLTDVPRLVRDERLAAHTSARLAAGERREPRSFFWSRGQTAGT
jgi:hypothetical protein